MVTENYNFLPDEAKEIRIKVFVEEQGFKQEFDELDSICTHLVTFDNDKPCATVRFYEQNSVYYIGRLAVLKEYRSKHLGAKRSRKVDKSKGRQRNQASFAGAGNAVLSKAGIYPIR